MAANQTTNYQLNQWEATDQVLRTDFNADNAKIDAALETLSEQAALMCRVVPDLAYYIGLLGVLDLKERGQYLSQRSILYEAFRFPEELALSGQAVIQDEVLSFSGSGSAATQNLSLGRSDWTQARLWLRFSGNGTLVLHLNGNEMEYVSSFRTRNAAGEVCWEREYLWSGAGTGAVQIKLTGEPGTESAMEVYDFRLAVF